VGLPLFADCFETKAFENVTLLYHLFLRRMREANVHKQTARSARNEVLEIVKKNSYFKCEKFDFQD